MNKKAFLPIMVLLLLSASVSAIVFFEDNFTGGVKPKWVEMAGPWEHNSSLDAYQIIWGFKGKTRVDITTSYSLVEFKIIEVSTLQNTYFDLMNRGYWTASPNFLTSGYSIAYMEVYSRLYDTPLFLIRWDNGSRSGYLDEVTWAELGLSGVEDLEGKTLGIKAKDDVITGYLDGVEILSAIDDTYAYGQAGIIANSKTEAFVFDDFKIRNPTGPNARDDYGLPAVDSSASNDNRYGVMLRVVSNYTLYTVQKNDSHNPGDIGGVMVYCDNTTTIVGNATSWTGAGGNNATFTTPVNMTAGYHYRIFEYVGASRTIKYGATGYFPVDGTYNNYTNACYDNAGGSCSTPHAEQRPNGAIIILYLDNLIPPPPDPFPTWSNNITNASSTISLGAIVNSWVLLADDDELSHFICNWNETGAWASGAANPITGNASYNASCIGGISHAPGDRLVAYNVTFNDSANQWNSTNNFFYNVVDAFPQWYNYSQNATEIVAFSRILFEANFTDDGNLSCNQLNIRNSSNHVTTNYSSCSWTSCAVQYTDCLTRWWNETSTAGVYGWRLGANDTANHWNYTPYSNWTVTSDNPPQWYNTTQSTSVLVLGESIYLTANMSDDYGLSHYSFWEQLPNGTWIKGVNATTWTQCPVDNRDCMIAIWGTPSPVGQHNWTFYFNDSNNQWNNTEIRNFTVLPYPNAAATLPYWRINPCISGPWQINENVTVSMRIADAEDDNVSGRVIFYDDNDTYRQLTSWESGESEAYLNFTFTNLTYLISSSTLVMQIRDVEDYYANGTIINTTQYFGVATAGFLYDECFTDIYTAPPPPPLTPDPMRDMFMGLLAAIAMPLTMLWLLIMVIMIIAIWVYFHKEALIAGLASFGVAIIWSFLGLTIGVISGVLFFLLMILVVGAGAFAVWMVMK